MLAEKTLIELKEYVDYYLNHSPAEILHACAPLESEILEEDRQPADLDEFIQSRRKPSLRHLLFSYIDQRGASDSEIYKKAGIDRRHFSKIRSNPDYRPRKNTVIALALALQLNIEEAGELLSSAGFSLSDSDTSDLVIQFCLEKEIYNLQDVNEALYNLGVKPL
ncbi:helix-turn-helix transcriptional regulator [Fictibacillus sp. WQ 8-8]|uniref:helix-turn-helix transcriptional regulator n=1 Tax=Fictibacillus sp. WQ 8-8 TaxID=2938788 RepID=UPI00210DDAE3|nr:helix-turn-helix transcriptional regulator [Fictibacillus sp. WQ 8-8]MCQ6268643.1 helix-turn-helix transcriptional regulator [Fictibacillus sp. WQ 8-8]